MALTRSDGLLYAIGQGYSALDAEAARNRLDGFAVVSGLGVTVNSGLTLSIASGTATVGETSNTVDTVSLGSSTPVTLNTADSTNPRKDTVYINTSGTVQVETGTAEAYDPSDETLFDTFQPEPPLPSTEGVILAEVVVPAGASSINTTDHVRDRRQPAQAVFDEVTSRSVFTDEADVTNETFVVGHLDSNISGVTAGTYSNIIDTEIEDNRDEFNGSFQFSPDSTGWYFIFAQARFNAGGDGDDIDVRLRNVTDDLSVANRRHSMGAAPGFEDAGPVIDFAELNSAKNYEFQAANLDSQYGIQSGDVGTYGVISKSLVIPNDT